MPKKASDDLTRKGDHKQETANGLKIPVPARSEFLRNLGKVAPRTGESEKAPRRTRRAES